MLNVGRRFLGAIAAAYTFGFVIGVVLLATGWLARFEERKLSFLIWFLLVVQRKKTTHNKSIQDITKL